MKERTENINIKEKKKNIFGRTLPIGLVCIVAALIMVVQGFAVQPEINKNREAIDALKAEIESELEKKEEVDRMSENADSDEYIEKIARDRLGMVKKDEIVFIDVSEKE